MKTHSGLSWDTGGDDNDVGAGEDLLEAIVGREVSLDPRGRRDVRKIGGDAGSVHDIIEPELYAPHSASWGHREGR